MLSRPALRSVLSILLLAAAAAPVEAGRTWSFYFENDVDALSGENNDRFYTNGVRIDVHWPVCALPYSLKRRWAESGKLPILFVPSLARVEAAEQGVVSAKPPMCRPSTVGVRSLSPSENSFSVGLRFGQSFYTPQDLDDPNLRPRDRPYAGWLYVGAVANWLQPRHMRTVQLDLGVVGPAAFAEEVQDFVHEYITDSREAQGWHHQIRNEPGILATYEERWKLNAVENRSGSRTFVDVIPKVGVNLGNVFTQGTVGVTARAGWNLPNDFGPAARLISVFESPTGTKGAELYLFAAAEGRGVARNIFLDGNTFRNSHSVPKEHFVHDLEWGLVARWKRWRLTYRRVRRSEEFVFQRGEQRFGSVNLTVLAK